MTNLLSVQLYTVRTEMAADRDGTLARLAEIGYNAVEPFDPATDPVGFRATLDRLGLQAPTCHGMAVLGDEPDSVLEAVATLGATSVIVPAGIPADEFTSSDGIARAADTLNDLVDKAAAFNLRLGYHNHWWEIEPEVDGVIALEALAVRLRPEVFLEVDTYWAAVGGADVAPLLKRLGDRVQALHVKDGPIVGAERGTKSPPGEPNVAVGSGAMPIEEVLAAAPTALRVVEFDRSGTDIFEGLAASHAYLTGIA